MSLTRPKVHRWAGAYGSSDDPWPGDLAIAGWLMAVYRFDGQHWRALRPEGSTHE